MNDSCSVCGQPGERTGRLELRPYGDGGAPICAGCCIGTPREATARAEFGKTLARHKRLGCDTQVQPGSATVPMIGRRR